MFGFSEAGRVELIVLSTSLYSCLYTILFLFVRNRDDFMTFYRRSSSFFVIYLCYFLYFSTDWVVELYDRSRIRCSFTWQVLSNFYFFLEFEGRPVDLESLYFSWLFPTPMFLQYTYNCWMKPVFGETYYITHYTIDLFLLRKLSTWPREYRYFWTR